MSSRLPWGNQSRICPRCGEVGPRVPNPTGVGYIHDRCRSSQEKNAAQREYRATVRKYRGSKK